MNAALSFSSNSGMQYLPEESWTKDTIFVQSFFLSTASFRLPRSVASDTIECLTEPLHAFTDLTELTRPSPVGKCCLAALLRQTSFLRAPVWDVLYSSWKYFLEIVQSMTERCSVYALLHERIVAHTSSIKTTSQYKLTTKLTIELAFFFDLLWRLDQLLFSFSRREVICCLCNWIQTRAEKNSTPHGLGFFSDGQRLQCSLGKLELTNHCAGMDSELEGTATIYSWLTRSSLNFV